MGLVPKSFGGELGPYSGAIAFAGVVAVVIVVSIYMYISTNVLQYVFISFINYNFYYII